MRGWSVSTTVALCTALFAPSIASGQGTPDRSATPLGVCLHARITCTDTVGKPGEKAALTARLMSPDGTTPVPGQPVRFTVAGRELPGSPVTTDQDGLACLPFAVQGDAGGDITYSATFAGCEDMGAAIGKGLVRRGPAPPTLSLQAPATAGANTYITIRARLTSGGRPVPGATIRLTFGGRRQLPACTNQIGDAYISFVIPAAITPGRVRFVVTTDDRYGPPTSMAEGSMILLPTTAGQISDYPTGEIRHGSPFRATLRSAMTRQPIPGRTLQVTVDCGRVSTSRTDSSGVADFGYLAEYYYGAKVIDIEFKGDSAYGYCRAAYVAIFRE